MQQQPPAVQAIVDFFENLGPAQVERLGVIYADDARFQDPFNDVRGLTAIQRIFAHMFVALHEPRFVVTGCVLQDGHCVLFWDFLFRFKSAGPGQLQTVQGCSHLQLAADGRINTHRDYWDAAGELYEKLPVLGRLMRWLRRRMGTPS